MPTLDVLIDTLDILKISMNSFAWYMVGFVCLYGAKLFRRVDYVGLLSVTFMSFALFNMFPKLQYVMTTHVLFLIFFTGLYLFVMVASRNQTENHKLFSK